MVKESGKTKLLFFITSSIIICGVFMFFMDCLKWNNSYLIELDIAIPNFFDLFFGRVGSPSITWPLVPGYLIIFILQILVSAFLFVTIVLLLFKGIKYKTATKVLLISSVVCLGLGILSFLGSKLVSNCSATFNFAGIEISKIQLKDRFALDLNYGAIVYGSTMIASSILGITTFIFSK